MEPFRREMLVTFGAEGQVVEELLAYNANVFVRAHPEIPKFPLTTEACTHYWADQYLAGAGFAALQAALPQLNFPIQQGLSQSSDYLESTRKGRFFKEIASATGLSLQAPEAITLNLYATAAGELPIVTIPRRCDFEDLVRALARRGEPDPIPLSMGAALVTGFNNWDRIHHYRRYWEQAHPNEDFWQVGFPILRLNKHQYQDTFILLSVGPYSGVPAKELGLDEATWLSHSLRIREGHEATHYFTRRLFSSMRNNIIDELLADYMGLVNALGYFRADWFLAFMGLSAWPEYRVGRRLENYCRSLSSAAFAVVQCLVLAAAQNLETFDCTHRSDLCRPYARAYLLMALTQFTLEELAHPSAPKLLLARWRQTMA